MNHLQRYNEFINEKIDYKDVITNIKKDLNINFTGIVTFGASISAFIPLVQHIIDDMPIANLSEEIIVLLSITAFGIIYRDNSKEIVKAYDYIKTHNLNDIFKKILEVLKSINNIYQFIVKKLKNTLEFLTDMLSYTMIFTPLLLLFYNSIKDKEITLDYLIRMGISITGGIITITMKNFIKEIYQKIKNKLISKFKKDDEQIVEKLNNLNLFESKNDPIPEIANIKSNDKYAIFVFGPPAAGKTTFINSYVMKFLRNYKIFNPDKLNKALKRNFDQYLQDAHLSNDYIKKTVKDLENYGIDITKLNTDLLSGKNNSYVDVTDKLLKTSLINYMKGGNTFIYDTTGNDFERIKYYVNQAKKYNYKTLFIEVKSNLSDIIKRNSDRHRTVPISYQMDSYLKSKENNLKFSNLNPDMYYVVINNKGKRRYYKLENGKLLKRKNDKYV